MIVGTAGHIDHGKTSLVRALSGVDTDRLKEEKTRGISIDLGFAYLPTKDGHVIGFVDVPGHERFIHNMLAGATGIDFVLLVIAADDGVMPQTIEHLTIVDLLGIDRGLVALTKCDLVDADRLTKVRNDIASALLPTALSGTEILSVSSTTGEGVDTLQQRLFAAADTLGVRAVKGRFRLAVDRSFTLKGTGTVVTGTVLSGTVSIGDHILISPAGKAARVRAIHALNRPAQSGKAGERCALNLAGDGISKDAIARGDVILDPELHAPTERIDALLRVLPSEPRPIGQWMPVRLHHAAAEIGARIVLLGDKSIEPGGEAIVQLVLERPAAAAAGDRFVLRDTSAQRTIGGGRFLDLRAPERMAQLQALLAPDPEQALVALLDRPPGYVDLTAFARDHALASTELTAMASRISLVQIAAPKAILALSPATWLRFKHDLMTTLEKFHSENPDLAGIGLEQLRLRLEPRLPAPAFAALLQGLQRNKDVSHEVRLTSEDEVAWTKIRPLIGGSERFRPPRARDIARILDLPEPDVRKLFKLLGRIGRVDEVAHDHFFLRAVVAEMVEISTELAAAGEGGYFSAAQFRDRLENGRKVAIQILEFFDRHGVTMRRGDYRRINKHRLDLFRRPSNDSEQEAELELGRETSPVGRPDFKSGKGRETALSGFDSHSLPPDAQRKVTARPLDGVLREERAEAGGADR
jgi:selenocysteine-specific elongation factor